MHNRLKCKMNIKIKKIHESQNLGDNVAYGRMNNSTISQVNPAQRFIIDHAQNTTAIDTHNPPLLLSDYFMIYKDMVGSYSNGAFDFRDVKTGSLVASGNARTYLGWNSDNKTQLSQSIAAFDRKTGTLYFNARYYQTVGTSTSAHKERVLVYKLGVGFVFNYGWDLTGEGIRRCWRGHFNDKTGRFYFSTYINSNDQSISSVIFNGTNYVASGLISVGANTNIRDIISDGEDILLLVTKGGVQSLLRYDKDLVFISEKILDFIPVTVTFLKKDLFFSESGALYNSKNKVLDFSDLNPEWTRNRAFSSFSLSSNAVPVFVSRGRFESGNTYYYHHHKIVFR